MQKKSLEVTCYVGGAGAFGVFLRWLQDQLAFDEAGLAERSVFHVLVPLFILACAIVFFRFVRGWQKEHKVLPTELGQALENKGRLFTVVRWAIGGLMCLGALALLAKSETDKLAGTLRLLALVALISGVAFPLALGEANKEKPRTLLLCALHFAPVFLFAVWMVYSYRANAINSVIRSYLLEILTEAMTMTAFFRMAGFAFGNPNGPRALFDAMFGAVACIMSLADERYMGMQLIFLSAGLMLILYNWIMVKNLKQEEVKPEEKKDDGFEHL